MSRVCFCTPEERVSRGCDGSLGGGNSSEGTISKRESELGDHSDAWSSHFMLGEAGVGGRMGMRSERPWGRLGPSTQRGCWAARHPARGCRLDASPGSRQGGLGSLRLGVGGLARGGVFSLDLTMPTFLQALQ